MEISDFIISIEESIQTALQKIDENQKGFLIVVEDGGKLCGTLTDGDIRRGMLRESGTFDLAKISVRDYCNPHCTSICEEEDFGRVIDIFKSGSIKFIPVTDRHAIVRNVITKANLHGVLLQNIPADLRYDFINMDETLLEYEIYDRPWGFYKTTIMNSFYQSKVIEIRPLQALSLQRHEHREEHWIVVSGEGLAQIGESRLSVQGGSYLFIPRNCRHRMQNTSGTENLIFIEVQLGRYFGEDDIIRLDDDYGRV